MKSNNSQRILGFQIRGWRNAGGSCFAASWPRHVLNRKHVVLWWTRLAKLPRSEVSSPPEFEFKAAEVAAAGRNNHLVRNLSFYELANSLSMFTNSCKFRFLTSLKCSMGNSRTLENHVRRKPWKIHGTLWKFRNFSQDRFLVLNIFESTIFL